MFMYLIKLAHTLDLKIYTIKIQYINIKYVTDVESKYNHNNAT